MSRYILITYTVNNGNLNSIVVSDLGNNSIIIDNNSSENTSDNTRDNATIPINPPEYSTKSSNNHDEPKITPSPINNSIRPLLKNGNDFK